MTNLSSTLLAAIMPASDIVTMDSEPAITQPIPMNIERNFSSGNRQWRSRVINGYAEANAKPTWRSGAKAIGAYARRVGEQSRIRGKRPISLPRITPAKPMENE